MKKLIVTVILSALVISSCILLKSQDDMMPPPNLKTFYMVLLKEGPNRNQDKQTTAELQRGHLNNIRKLAEDGKIILAGPFTDDSDIRGIFVFDAESKEEVEELCATDPAIKAGRLIAEVHPWMTEPGRCLPE